MFEEKKAAAERKKLPLTRADLALAGILGVIILTLMSLFAKTPAQGETLSLSHDGETLASLSLMEEKETRYCLIVYGETGASLRWFESRQEALSQIPGAAAGRAGGGAVVAVSGGETGASSVTSGYNLLSVSSERVSMEAADCPDLICVRHKPISGGGESIICLPHRLAVEIRGGKTELDGM